MGGELLSAVGGVDADARVMAVVRVKQLSSSSSMTGFGPCTRSRDSPAVEKLESICRSNSSAMSTAESIAKLARAAYEASQLVDSEDRVAALHAISVAISTHKDEILEANAKDMDVRPTLPFMWELLKYTVSSHASK